MKAIAFGNRLARDFGTDSFVDMSADARLEILDAINGGLQRLHSVAPSESKITTAGIYLSAPLSVTIGVVNGSPDITGYSFDSEALYRTIRIPGDIIDNQVSGGNNLLHTYTGPTGNVTATVFSDAITIPEPYDELVGSLRVLESGRELSPFIPPPYRTTRSSGEPRYYYVEPNARNQSPPAPSVIRLDSLPITAHRLEAKFTLAPARVSFAELLSPGASLPIREEFVEIYLLPIARGILASSSMWKDNATRTIVLKSAEKAESAYEMLVPRTLATPRNYARTKQGY